MASATSICTVCLLTFELAAPVPSRPTCPLCSALVESVALRSGEEIQVFTAVGFQGDGRLEVTEIRATVNNHERTAARRYEEARAELAAVSHSISPADTNTMLERQKGLHWVFEQCWSLREAAIAAGVSRGVVDAAIGASSWLSLAHDLGNLAKHGALNRRTQTGGIPAFGPPEMVTVSGSATTFEQEVLLNNVSQGQGADVAAKALDEWKALLQGWGIL